MTIEEIRALLDSPQYDFLRTNPHLGDKIIFLGLGGSYSYGTNTDTSDVDIRGVALNSKEEILLGNDFEQVVTHETDTTIYSVKKIFKLLVSNNPNIIELLGIKPEHILYETDEWKKIRENTKLFLSKQCIYTFGGYANAQLRRMNTKAARLSGQSQREEYIFNSIRNAEHTFRERHTQIPDDNYLRLYIAASSREDMESEIFVDTYLQHYPLRDLAALVNDYHSVVSGYDKIGKRNKYAIKNESLGKHCMHLVRLYLMAFDILEKGEINTFRENEHDFLMEIRNGKYLDSNNQPTDEFYELIDQLNVHLKEASAHTYLPEKPDVEAIKKLEIDIIRRVLP